MNEVATLECGTDLTSVPDHRDSDMPLVEFLQKALTNPDIDANKVAVLIGVYEKREDDWRRRRYNEALLGVQTELDKIKRGRRNTHTNSDFADLDIIEDHLHDILVKYGFTESFSPVSGPLPDHVYEQCIVTHRDGYERTYGPIGVPYDGVGPGGKVNKTPTHAAASAHTYAQRYLKAKIWNLRFGRKDDDGNSASSRPYDNQQGAQRQEGQPSHQNSGRDHRSLTEQAKAGAFNRKKTDHPIAQEFAHPEDSKLGKAERRIASAGETPRQLEGVRAYLENAKALETVDEIMAFPIVRKLRETPDNNTLISSFEAAARKRLAPGRSRTPFIADIHDYESGAVLQGPYTDATDWAIAYRDHLKRLSPHKAGSSVRFHWKIIEDARGRAAEAKKYLVGLEVPNV